MGLAGMNALAGVGQNSCECLLDLKAVALYAAGVQRVPRRSDGVRVAQKSAKSKNGGRRWE